MELQPNFDDSKHISYGYDRVCWLTKHLLQFLHREKVTEKELRFELNNVRSFLVNDWEEIDK